ncbi:MAG: DivIVA domain-containing protein [bacterium]|nr:DivIVA domain-containing protein [bacterium]
MRITPLDVRKQEFRKSVRGFDCDEVRVFLTTLADEYETVLVDNKVLRERLNEQDDKINEYMGMERTLRDTLMTAERVMQETKDNASREGDLVVQEAQLTARSILEECRVRTEELRREMISLRTEKEAYLARFKGLAEAQIQFIETHKDDFADLDKRLIDMADKVVGSGTSTNSKAVNQISSTAVSGADQWRDYSPETSAKTPSISASVDFAAMGVPVPMNPHTEDTESEVLEEANILQEDPLTDEVGQNETV